MPVTDKCATLSRVLVVHNRSLPRYLMDAAPWLRPGEGRAHEAIEQIAHDHEQVVDRIGSLLSDENQPIDLGEYPMVFTAYHDVAFDFLLPILIDRQERTVRYLQQCVAAIDSWPLAKALVEETVGMAKAHLDMLRELTEPAAPRLALAAGESANGDDVHSSASAAHAAPAATGHH
jgi:hypothetical protein